jgi:hypothetical protein
MPTHEATNNFRYAPKADQARGDARRQERSFTPRWRSHVKVDQKIIFPIDAETPRRAAIA